MVKATITTANDGLSHTAVVEYEAKDKYWYVVMAYLLKDKITHYTGSFDTIELYLRELVWDVEEEDHMSFSPNDHQTVIIETTANAFTWET